ncbi:hypothetical protein LMTR13_12330 [Bradyrhizobium icense]|uniref:YqhA family protein n=2 Tax=Bradyrhizobium icense TaxID=1274631 RepID=A0A1B1URS7_9BRAD|nr:hypothetical protein LMTR13_12330 [Bradyrhizobium icense]
MNLRQTERAVIVASRFFTLIAVFGSLIGAFLMFLLGFYNIYAAVTVGLQPADGHFGTAAIISVIEALDRFLIAIVLLYFSYGVYSLFIHPEEPEERLAIPAWLRVQQIGQLKQVVTEVIVVVLFVLFLRVALETFVQNKAATSWLHLGTIALLPVSILLLSLSLRMVELHPKPGRSEPDSEKRR